MNAFAVLIKPASSLCNMRCAYCFYHSTSSARENPSYGLMGEATAHALVDRAFSHLPSPFSVSFLFQGGEPTLAGLPFFREFIRYAKERLPARCEVRYALQTNGLLIDEDWCAFLKENRFLVGLSLDGDKDVHDLLRIDAAGKGTFSRVLAAAKLFDKIGVDYNILTVVTRTLERRIRAVWNTYQKLGFRYLQFIPCLPPFDGAEEKHALTPALYATFLKESFALWADGIRRGNYVSVRFFDNLVLLLRGMPAEQCGLSGRCRFQFVTEADGGIYPCDFYCLDEFRCGNVSADTLETIEKSAAGQAFLADAAQWSPLCGGCSYRSICGGGCKRYQSFYFSTPGYCPHKDFLDAAIAELSEIARTL